MSTPADYVESEQTKAREFFVGLDHPVVGKYGQVRALHTYSASPSIMRTAAPLIGQHNEEILMGELGLSREDLMSLRAGGVI